MQENTMLRMLLSFFALLVGLTVTLKPENRGHFPGEELIGTKAEEWNNNTWINSTPLRLSDLRGRVVLVRFFTDRECPFCGATAPALNEFHSKYAQKGLVVIGMYTPKPRPQHRSVEQVKETVSGYGFKFPVAVDNDWSALRRMWLDRVPEAKFTSSSLLIDKRGVIRYVHPGGEFSKDSSDEKARRSYHEIKKIIEILLQEPKE